MLRVNYFTTTTAVESGPCQLSYIVRSVWLHLEGMGTCWEVLCFCELWGVKEGFMKMEHHLCAFPFS